jgi:hypothetical protein
VARVVQGLDKRVMVEQLRAQEGAAKEKESRLAREREKKAAKQAARQQLEDEPDDPEAAAVETEFWNRVQVPEESAASMDEENELACAVCSKVFRSVGARDSHLNSKKHKEEVERLRSELSLAGEELPAELDLKPETPVAQPPSGGRKKKGKKKGKDAEEEEKKVVEEPAPVEEEPQ